MRFVPYTLESKPQSEVKMKLQEGDKEKENYERFYIL